MSKMISIYLILVSSVSMAGGGSGKVSDLFFPAINFVILFGFIIFKYKGVISSGYTEQSLKIENLLNDAAAADKQASLKLDSLKKELKNIELVKNELKNKANENLNIQVKLINDESNKKIIKLKEDKESKFKQEKNTLMNEVNSKVIDLVIENAKVIVADDKNRKLTTEKKLLSAFH